MKYYVRDGKGRVSGPFSVEALKKAAREGKILPSWHLSSTQEKWTLAAKAPDLFPTVDTAIETAVTGVNKYRDLSRKEQVSLFIDKFIFNNDHFKESMPWLQYVRLWWAKLTLPSNGFVIAEISPGGIKHVRYDFSREGSSDIGEAEFEQEIREGIRQSNWFTGFAVVLSVVWLVWMAIDFVGQFSLTLGSIKLLLPPIVLVMGFIYKAKRTKVFIGYILAPEAEAKLKQLQHAFATLSRCSRVWAYKVQANVNDKQWKYNAGGLFSVAKLPVAIFNRPIPNIETNITVCGVTYNQFAIYFLPEKLLIINGQDIRYVEYSRIGTSQNHLEYVESSGQVYPDSMILEKRWLRINRDGSPDRRFKANFQVPVVRCGILNFDVSGSPMSLLTTDPNAPETFRRNMPKL